MLRALRLIDGIEGVSVAKISSLYETEPLNCPPQPNFINAVVEVRTLLIPEDLLNRLRVLESKMGRTGGNNQPQKLDIDVISYDSMECGSKDLVLPHPRYSERAFVLIPMKEIAPDFTCPLKGHSLQEMIDKLPRIDCVRRVSSRKAF